MKMKIHINLIEKKTSEMGRTKDGPKVQIWFENDFGQNRIFTKVIVIDNKSFVTDSHMLEARYYDEDVGIIRFSRRDKYGKPKSITVQS